MTTAPESNSSCAEEPPQNVTVISYTPAEDATATGDSAVEITTAPAADDPPPYESLYVVLKGQRQYSSGVFNFMKRAAKECFEKVFGVLFIVIMIIVMVLLGLALPIAEIVIGAKYKDDCPAEKYLPIYLIVSGVFIALCSFCGGGSTAAGSSDEDGDAPPIGLCCNSIIGVFMVAWLIAGTVWVTRMVDCADKGTSNCFATADIFKEFSFYCPKVVYEFTYWDIMVKWMLLGVASLATITCCSILACLYYCMKSDE